MEEYIRDRAKHKAIAVYAFNSINCDGSTSIKTVKLKDSLRETLKYLNCRIELEEIDKIIDSVDRFQKQFLELE